MHARSRNETEIERDLKEMGYSVDQTTISRDLKAIKEEVAQQFIFDLAKYDLAYYYKGCLDTIDQVKRECWSLYNENKKKKNGVSIRDKLTPLSLIKECSVERYKLLAEGPSIMALRSLEERLANIERNQQKLEEEKKSN